MNKHDEALHVLLIVRRRLLDRMASLVVENRDVLLNGHRGSDNPLHANQDLAKLISNLNELDGAIAGLADLSRFGAEDGSAQSSEQKSLPKSRNRLFDRFGQLVEENRLEEASRELSRILKMHLDRMITATRFFARSSKTDPALMTKLTLLCDHISDWSESDCVKTLIRVFGFQAVESRNALASLRARAQGLTDAPQTNAISGLVAS